MGKKIEIKPNDQSCFAKKIRISTWDEKIYLWVDHVYADLIIGSCFYMGSPLIMEKDAVFKREEEWELYEEEERVEKNIDTDVFVTCRNNHEIIKFRVYEDEDNSCPLCWALGRLEFHAEEAEKKANEAESKEEKKTKRMAAPALIYSGLTFGTNGTQATQEFSRFKIISPGVFEKEGEARDFYGAFFIQWPAGEGYWVEVPE